VPIAAKLAERFGLACAARDRRAAILALGRALLMLGVCACVVIGVGVGSAVAQPVVPRPVRIPEAAAPTFSAFTSRDGLSDDIWSAVAVDGDGFVWAGSASSLARFDGYRWTMWPFPEAHSLVRELQADDRGHLWALFEREGLAHYDGRRWRLVAEPRGGRRFSVIERDGQREYWLADERQLARLRDGAWRVDGGPPFPPAPAVIERTDTLFGGPREWVGSSSDGLWYRTRSKTPAPWTRFEHPDVIGGITGVLRSEAGGREELWVLSGTGLARIRDAGVRVWSAARGELPTTSMYDIVQTRGFTGDPTIWIASRAGLLRVRGDRLDVFEQRHGLPSDAVRGLTVQHTIDGVDVLWLATEGGMARAVLTDSPWQTVSLLGARDNGVLGLMFEPDGQGGERLWAGSSRDGLGMLEHGHWRYFTHEAGNLPAPSVRGIWRLPDPSGRCRRLLGLFGVGLLEVKDDFTIVPFATPWTPQAEDTAMHALARRFDGALEWWIATRRSGVHRWRHGRWTSYALPGTPQPWPVYALAEQIDDAGRSWLWAAGGRGLARFDGTQWQPLSDGGVLDDGFTSMALFRVRGQELWVGSLRNGVVRLDVSDALHPHPIDAALPAPPDPTVYSVVHDSRGRVYVCTNNGVQQLTPADGGGYTERVFRRSDGLVHDECNQGSEIVDAQDRYWVGTMGGLAMFDPGAQRPAAQGRAKPLRFVGLRVDGQDRLVADGEGLSLPADVHELRIEYTLLSGLRESETRYRSQLLGYDPAPTAWGTGRVRTFTALPPGAYELTVEARDYMGTPSQATSLRFSIAPQWYQRRGLQAFVVLLSGLGVAGAAVSYDRLQRRRRQRLQEEIALRTEELRAVNTRLTELSYLDPLTGLANRRRLMEVLTRAIARARERQLPIGLILIDVDHFKAYNDRHGHLAGDTALRAVAQVLDHATRPQDLVSRFGGEEFACVIDDAEIAAVRRVAERMRDAVESLPPRTLGNGSQTITLSAGVLCRVPGPDEQADDLLTAADAMLYEAKRLGRNRVEII
jgi:diguanylate cyclase (GGDEF)-like protein